jgi:hypothetical protein
VETHLNVSGGPWRIHLRRDAALRRLLRALYQHRDDVLACYPHVPLTDETSPERTAVSALILLWERWDYLRGSCPACGSDALGVAFGGLLSCGQITGCCLGCARFVSRFIGGAGLIQSAINDRLSDTPYRLTLSTRAVPPGGQALYGGWGWSLPRRVPALEAVLQELGG